MIAVAVHRQGCEMNKRRITLAFLVAPLVPSIYFLSMMGFSNKNVIVMMLVYSVCFSYLPTICVGIPLLSVLGRTGHLNVLSVVIGGAIAGMIVFYVFGLVFMAMLGSVGNIAPSISGLIWGAIFGISVALPFSLIAGIPMRKKIM